MGASTGAVTVIQRFDSVLALNVYFHSFVLELPRIAHVRPAAR